MDNTNNFEDFDIEIKDTSQPKLDEISEKDLEETVPETISLEESTSNENANTKDLNGIEDSLTNENKVEDSIELTSINGLINKLFERIENLTLQNDLLHKKFDNKIAEDEHKAQLFDKMYNELQSYKNDLYAKIIKPFILSTIILLDDTSTYINKLGENDSVLAEKYLRSIPDDLIDILESNGVTLYEDEDEKFNARTQKVMKKIPTDNPELDNFIAKRIRKGYNWNGVNLRPELVWIYKFEQENQINNENI